MIEVGSGMKKQELSAAAKIGAYIKYQREKRNKSLNEFAKLINVDPSFILRLENGVYQSIGLDVVEKIAEGLEMGLEDLLGKAGLLSRYKGELPEVEFFLKEKYQFPRQAIHDVIVFLKFVEERYKKEIERRRKVHKKYWSKRRGHG
jgi:transcriptional regulator with XRE-family HTH domain